MSNRIDYAFHVVVLLFMFVVSACIFAASAQAYAGITRRGDFPVVRFLLSNAKSGSLPGLRLEKKGKAKVVTTCKAFIENIVVWQVRKGVNNMRALADYQPCVARYIFQHGKASSRSRFHHDFYSVIVKSLDLTSFPSSLQHRLGKHNKTLISLGLRHAVTSETTVLLKPKGRSYRFDLLAKGDFTHDGDEDLLVQFIDKAQRGNYLAVETLVLTKPHHRGLWKAINGIDFVRYIKSTVRGHH